MNSAKQFVSAPCPDCGYEIRLGPNPQRHEKFTCPECWAYLEVISLDPVKLAWESEEDWDEAEEP